MSRNVYGDYNNQRIFATLSTGTYTLQTANKVMVDDVVIHSDDAHLVVTYNNNDIIDTTTDGVYTLKTKGKKCATDIVVDVQSKGVSTFYVIFEYNQTGSSWRYNEGAWISDTSSDTKWYTGGSPFNFQTAKTQAAELHDVTELSTQGSGNWDEATIYIYDGSGNLVTSDSSVVGIKDWTSYLTEGGMLVFYQDY